MFAFIEGKLEFKSPTMVHINTNGIGYEMNISMNTYTDIQTKDSIKLWAYLQIKEDAHTLFGFSTLAEKEVFVQLISVSGVGAATARLMLSFLKPEEVVQAIVNGNVRLLESVKGIGKKTAERILLELRDKMNKVDLATKANGTESNWAKKSDLQEDALATLITLGIAKNQAANAIEKTLKHSPDINNLEDLIKNALKAI